MTSEAAPSSQTPVLAEASGIDVSFAGTRVLSKVDIRVRQGEVVTLIGPNGSGKTTLIRVLLGLVKPDAGEVKFSSGIRIGYMPQHLTLDPVVPLTVNRFLQLDRRRAAQEIEQHLAEVGAGHAGNLPLQSLSGGELRRVLLARALLRSPDLLVLDEPVQGVDLAGQAELYELIGHIRHRRNCGVLMVSHDLHVVMAATDQVVCLNHHVCCAGHPEAVSRHPEYIALFGPRIASTVAIYSHSHDHGHDVAGAVVAPPNGEQSEEPPGGPSDERPKGGGDG